VIYRGEPQYPVREPQPMRHRFWHGHDERLLV